MTTYNPGEHGYLYRGGSFLTDAPTIINDTTREREISIDLGRQGVLSFTYEAANPLLVAIVERMFDADAIDMATAERLSYLSNIVLRDPHDAMAAAADSVGEEW